MSIKQGDKLIITISCESYDECNFCDGECIMAQPIAEYEYRQLNDPTIKRIIVEVDDVEFYMETVLLHGDEIAQQYRRSQTIEFTVR